MAQNINLETILKLPLGKKLAVLGLFLVLFGVAFYMIYYAPVIEELDGLRTQHEQLQTELADAQRRKARYDQDVMTRDKLKKMLAQQLHTLPPQTEMSSFLNHINTQADLVGIEILSVVPEPEEAEEYYARIPVRLRLRGTFLQVAKFFFLIGNLERIINVQNIRLTDAKFEDGMMIMNVDAMATTFRSTQPIDLPGAAQPNKG